MRTWKNLRLDQVTPHIYGKKNDSPFQKMGHVTIVNSDIEEARRIEAVKNRW
jgi:5-(carboxyamino)imidazole ribonucleotide synthase